MNTQMTERFSAPGATLVKLFGDPRRESREFGVRGRTGARHRRAHRDAAVDVHELADVDVGAGAGAGVRAGRGAGDRRATAGRRHRVAGAAVDPAVRAADRAGQCAGRDRHGAGQFRAGLRGARPGAADPRAPRRRRGARPGRRSRVEFDDVRFSYPAADKVSLASLEEVAELDDRGGREVLHGISFTAQPGRWWRWSGHPERESRRSRRCWRDSTTSTPARSGSTVSTCAT